MKTISENRKAKFNYDLLDFYNVGICLFGSEVKSIRLGNVNISESFCYVDEYGEVWIKNMYIKQYEYSGYVKFDSYRDKKLLLKKQEIRKLSQKVSQKGCTIVPTKLFINDKGLIKLEVALAKGKNTVDKKQYIKERDIKRDMETDV